MSVQSSPLTVEQIILSCKSNPARRNFPQFMTQRGWPGCSLQNENGSENLDSYLCLVHPGAVAGFNNKQITLNDGQYLNQAFGQYTSVK